MKTKTSLVLAACLAVTIFIAVDFVRVRSGWSRSITYELIGEEECFIRETRRGFIVHTARDLPERYGRRPNGLAALEVLEAHRK